jgi:hypothetical protein
MSWTVVIVDSASRRCSSSAQQCGRLERHRDEQEKERVAAAQLWRDSGGLLWGAGDGG